MGVSAIQNISTRFELVVHNSLHTTLLTTLSRSFMPPLHYYAQSFPTDPQTNLPTPSSLRPLLTDPTLTPQDTIVLYVSSLHFGTSPKPYLHLNDTNIDALAPFWQDLQQLCKTEAVCRVEVRVMLGGAGGAYSVLFSDVDTYYGLLHAFLKTYPFLSGIDLDIEEELDPVPAQALKRVQSLIGRLFRDFVEPPPQSWGDTSVTTTPPFSITMAPVAASLLTDSPGMGGFVYKDIAKSAYGHMVSQYNVQAYGSYDSYDSDTFHRIVNNGYPPEQLVYGMLGDEYGQATPFATAMTELQRIAVAYPTFGGAVLWEFGDTRVGGVVWGQEVRRAVGGRGGVEGGGDKGEGEGGGDLPYRGCVVV